jgi:uncharacterized membrane protein YkvA (DUF1232 family)
LNNDADPSSLGFAKDGRTLAKGILLSILQDITQWARRVKRDAVTLWFAYRHPGTSWLPKAMAAFVVAYALSPIDLIPDFVPVLGYFDDALLLPALIWLTIRMLPCDVLADCRIKADEWMSRGEGKPRSRWGAALVIVVWIGAAALLWSWFQ